jgi:hypothetical protein
MNADQAKDEWQPSGQGAEQRKHATEMTRSSRETPMANTN